MFGFPLVSFVVVCVHSVVLFVHQLSFVRINYVTSLIPFAPTLEINSGKFEIIRTLKLGDDLFRGHPNPIRKKGKF